MSSNCSNCYNGCTEIVSDRCVKYTGIDVPVLGIQTGDSLSYVEQALITFLTSTLDGTGIKIDLTGIDICTLVQSYLPTCGDISIVDISKALIQAACDIQEQVDAIDAKLVILNADYTIGCLTGVTASSDTHAIVQAVINKVCQLGVDLVALALDLETNYISVDNIDSYIAAYIGGSSQTTLMSNKMVPYTPIPFYPTVDYLSGKFDGTGAGIGNWLKIYLCNGSNGTPDLRGRTLVGTTTGMGGGAFNPFVDPSILGNPNYSLGTVTGTNQITLSITQIPTHTHIAIATSTITPSTHSHLTAADETAIGLTATNPIAANYSLGGNLGYALKSATGTIATLGKTNDVTLSATATTLVSNASVGGGLPHSNIQPGIGCYYIMYIP